MNNPIDRIVSEKHVYFCESMTVNSTALFYFSFFFQEFQLQIGILFRIKIVIKKILNYFLKKFEEFSKTNIVFLSATVKTVKYRYQYRLLT